MANIINLDTGCGKGGLLTIYNLETGNFTKINYEITNNIIRIRYSI